MTWLPPSCQKPQTYKYYGGYWLLLAESYYRNEEFQKCIDAIEKYEELDIEIFRKDYEYAKKLPLAIVAAKEVLDSDEYVKYASDKIDRILTNTDNDEWALRYFAAQSLIDLYSVDDDLAYLQRAYNVLVNNVNNLVSYQRDKNSVYLNKVEEIPVPQGDQKKQIEEYNRALRDNRIKEMPPVYEPLIVNCDLLFSVAKKLDIDEANKAKIDKILHPDNSRLFLTETIDDQYWFNNTAESVLSDGMSVEFGGFYLILPVAYLSEDATIKMTVSGEKPEEPLVVTDWKVDRVDRGTEGDLSSFSVSYTSDNAFKHEWVPGELVDITIKPKGDVGISYTCKYKAIGTKNEWFDYLKVWEGHRNNWYDYLKVWENTVNFVEVS